MESVCVYLMVAKEGGKRKKRFPWTAHEEKIKIRYYGKLNYFSTLMTA